MSKAFTREEDGGLTPVDSERAPTYAPLTHMGRAALRTKVAAANAAEAAGIEGRLAAGVVSPPQDPRVASLGAEVTLVDEGGRERIVRLVTPDEVGLVERGTSPTSPIGAAVVGLRVGDDVELPDGVELAVARIVWPIDEGQT